MRAPTHHPHQKPGFGERLLASYERGLRKALAHQRLMLGVFGLTLALAVVGYILIPKGFFPVQDTAFALGTTEAAIKAFQAGGFEALVETALTAADHRAAELAEQLGK